MRSMHARRRVMESVAKLRELSELESDARLTIHALNEASLHQLAATWLALVRQVGDAHGIAIDTIESLDDLLMQLTERALPSVEAEYLRSLNDAPGSWLTLFFEHYYSVQCPIQIEAKQTDLVPMRDTSILEKIIKERYRPWVLAMIELVDLLQMKFDES